MQRTGAVALATLLGLVVLAPATLPLAEPAASQGPEPAAEAPDAESVKQEINEFYNQYWAAWDSREPNAVAAFLATDFVGLSYGPQGVLRTDKTGAVAGIRRFFDAVGEREMLWGRRVLAIEPQSATQALAAVRNDFALRNAGGEIELTLEVVQKGPDGRWKLARKYSERLGYR